MNTSLYIYVLRLLMRLFLTTTLAFLFALSYGQGFTYPEINKKGEGLSDFVPLNWTILDSATGDLNKDGINDAAIILQYKDSVTLIKAEGDTVLTQPRILIILFKDTSDDNYHLIEQSNSFILNHGNPAMDDPYVPMIISKGVLIIAFHIFYNAGSWYVTNADYRFRYQNKEFVLIGANYFSFHRATTEFENYSYNFLTNKRELKKGNDQETTQKTYWKTLKIPELKTLKTLKQPFTWHVEEDVYL
jgi:hypothetical protein